MNVSGRRPQRRIATQPTIVNNNLKKVIELLTHIFNAALKKFNHLPNNTHKYGTGV